MAKYNSLAELFTAIADAIRAKKGGEDTIVAEDFPAEIEGILSTDTKITSISSDADSVGDKSFFLCEFLKKASFPLATSIGKSAFTYCNALQTVDFPLATSIGKSAFAYCSALQTVDFPLVTSIGKSAFYDCSWLKVVILRTDTMCTLADKLTFAGCDHIEGGGGTMANPDGLKDGYFYVPSSLVETYKADSLWAEYSTQFRALEDYTVDGTTTGALDESKI